MKLRIFKIHYIHSFVGSAEFLLSACCLFGLLCGTFLGVFFSDSYGFLMRMAATCRVSIVGLGILLLLPLFLSFLCIHCGRPKLLYGICFLKSFMLGLCAMGCFYAFGSGGWLVRLLVQFSDLITFPILCWFMLRCISNSGKGIQRDYILCNGAFLLVGILDFFYISPYLVMLIDY